MTPRPHFRTRIGTSRDEVIGELNAARIKAEQRLRDNRPKLNSNGVKLLERAIRCYREDAKAVEKEGML